MLLTKDIAEKLDFILKEAQKTDKSTIDVSQCTSWDRYDLDSVEDYLVKTGLGKRLTHEWFMIFPKGVSFIRSNSFVQMYNEQQERERREERQDALTQKQIKAAKREPYLIAWSIVSTIISLILAFLQFVK
jgi:hypothetical protein